MPYFYEEFKNFNPKTENNKDNDIFDKTLNIEKGFFLNEKKIF